MNDRQTALLPYVEKRIEEILSEKEAKTPHSVQASELEVIRHIREDVLECLRELHRTHRYEAFNTLNNPSVRRIKKEQK